MESTMTTWPGFGDGTFHDPDRREEQPQGHDIGPIGTEIDSFLGENIFYLRYRGETYIGQMTPEKAMAFELTDPFEVTEAMKIMYPEVK